MVYNFVADNYTGLFSFVSRCWLPNSSKFWEFKREFELTAGQGYPRSSILVLIESAYANSYQSLIITLDVCPAVFEILTFKARNGLFDAPALGTR